MLVSLHIKNYILIDDLEIDFKKGLTVLTGETGAGKSMIIDALMLLAGAKASSDVIRGEENPKASIEACFDECPTSKIASFIEDGILEDENDLLVLKREILRTGKSVYRINSNVVNASLMEELTSLLYDIHVQHDTLRLFNQKNYLSFIDNEEIDQIKLAYQNQLNLYLDSFKHYDELLTRKSKVTEELDYKKYQLEELTSSKLLIDEDTNIEKELSVLNNFETLSDKLNNLHELLSSNETLDNLYQVLNILKELNKIDPSYDSIIETISQAYYELDDLSESTAKKLSSLDYDEKKVNYLNERLSTIERLKKKYHLDLKGLIDYIEKLNTELTEDENLDFYLSEAKTNVKKRYDELITLAGELTNLRIKQSSLLKEEITKSLKDLQLDKVDLAFNFEKIEPIDEFDYKKFTKNGLDNVDILVSFNIGEELKPIRLASSGGELSRVMLAFKNSLFIPRKLQLVVFDEIDTGVSGIQADSVARKLKEMSNNFQILAVTHLPIVASKADTQILVKKSTDLFRTSTEIKELNHQERVEVLAKMISPLDTSGKSLEVAEELLKNQ